jgi:formate hydrogenlyase subunit 3/multisubunit Na+/H+ antiporter MnhD subunit
MNRYQIVKNIDSERAVYSATGALVAAAAIIISVMYWHSGANASQSLASHTSMNSAYRSN